MDTLGRFIQIKITFYGNSREHYKKLIYKQSFTTENTLLYQNNLVDFPIQKHTLAPYDELMGDTFYE